MPKLQKATIEYDAKFLADWRRWCDQQGLQRRVAAIAAEMAFMQMGIEQREEAMKLAMPYVLAKK